jgi:hypothetical protein
MYNIVCNLFRGDMSSHIWRLQVSVLVGSRCDQLDVVRMNNRFRSTQELVFASVLSHPHNSLAFSSDHLVYAFREPAYAFIES